MVSAMVPPFHLICSRRGVFSSSGGRGKDCTLSLALVAILITFISSLERERCSIGETILKKN